MRKLVSTLACCFLLAGVALAQSQGIASNAGDTARAQNQNGQIVLSGTEPNQHLQREVLHELLMLPYYSVFDDLRFQVNGSTVVLMGDVVNPTLKSDAANSVKHIEGVTNVVNNIKVLPPSPMDDQIRRQEYRAIYGNDSLYRYAMGAVPSIHIIVDNGHVTLTGVVDSASDAQLATMRASQVPGVFGKVNNELSVNNSKSGE